MKYYDLPPLVVEKGKLAVLDAVGISIGAYPISWSRTFLELAKDLGCGRGEATLIGDGTKVSVPLAAFGNGALSFMLDYNDYHPRDSGVAPACVGALAVPAALAAGEVRGISGKELIVSVVAGYECAARIIHSMDMALESAQKLNGESVSVFTSAGAAGRALGLSEGLLLARSRRVALLDPRPGPRLCQYLHVVPSVALEYAACH